MHSQKIRIVGALASTECWDEHPNQLTYEVQGEPPRILDRGMPYLERAALAEDRIGGGHTEGLFTSWANLHVRFAPAMEARDDGDPGRLADIWFPDIRAGVEGVRFVEHCVRSADGGAVWIDYR